jgi:hypothetical protein
MILVLLIQTCGRHYFTRCSKNDSVITNLLYDQVINYSRDTHGRGEKSVQGFWCESPKERGHSEDRGVDGKMESEWILGRLAGGGVEWIQLAQDRDR